MNPFTKKSQVHMNLPVRDQPMGSRWNADPESGPGHYETFGPGDIVEVIGSDREREESSIRAPHLNFNTYNEKLSNRDIRKLANNTYLERIDENQIGIKLHNTYIIRFFSDGTFSLHTGGYNTVTTRDRMNNFGPISVRGENADRAGRADDLVADTPWGPIDVENMKLDNSTGYPVEWQGKELPPHPADYAGQQGEILYKDEKRSKDKRWYNKNVWKVYFPDGDVAYFEDHNLKLIKPYMPEERLQELHPTPEIEGEEDVVIASKNPFKRAQELKNDTYSEETEQPSDPESDTGHNLEFVDRSDDKKNTRPTHHQGPVKSASNPFKRALTEQDTAETGHIGNSDPVDKPTGGGRSPGDLDNPTPNNPFAHERGENSKGEQIA